MVGVRVSATREAHHREGHEMFSVDALIAEETRIFDLVDAADNRARLDVRTADLADFSADQARAIANIAVSPYLVQPVQAPAGAGKTHSLQPLRAAALRARQRPAGNRTPGRAVDEAMRGGAGDRGLTVAKALRLIEDDQLQVDRCTVIVVDEASMVGTAELRRLIEASTAARAKMVLVGDAYQLAPVKAGGGMFAHLCGDLPWSQRLSQVWRMRDPGERDASLALRSARQSATQSGRAGTATTVARTPGTPSPWLPMPPMPTSGPAPRQGCRNPLRHMRNRRRHQPAPPGPLHRPRFGECVGVPRSTGPRRRYRAQPPQ